MYRLRTTEILHFPKEPRTILRQGLLLLEIDAHILPLVTTGLLLFKVGTSPYVPSYYPLGKIPSSSQRQAQSLAPSVALRWDRTAHHLSVPGLCVCLRLVSGPLGPRLLMTPPDTSTRWCPFSISALGCHWPHYPLPLHPSFCNGSGTLAVERELKRLLSKRGRA